LLPNGLVSSRRKILEQHAAEMATFTIEQRRRSVAHLLCASPEFQLH
jgi:hypothetical protein